MLERSDNDEKDIQESARFWHGMSNVSLSDEDLNEAHSNLAGFFQVLSEWDMRSKENHQK